jgi:hypothetical protein
MDTRFTLPVLDQLAWRIASDGIDSIPLSTLHDLGFEARDAAASATLVAVLVDCDQPVVARERAFGRVAAWLAGYFSTAGQLGEPTTGAATDVTLHSVAALSAGRTPVSC